MVIFFVTVVLRGEDVYLYGKLIKDFKVKDFNGTILNFPQKEKINIILFLSNNYLNKASYVDELSSVLKNYKKEILRWIISKTNLDIKEKKVWIINIPDHENKIKKLFNLMCLCNCISVGIIKNGKIMYFDYSPEVNFIKMWIKENTR